MSNTNMRLLLTPAMAKTLIAMGVACLDCVNEKLKSGMIVICGGTTNSYVAQALLKKAGYDIGSLKTRMFRGVTTPF